MSVYQNLASTPGPQSGPALKGLSPSEPRLLPVVARVQKRPGNTNLRP
jgi:hypothetical protein